MFAKAERMSIGEFMKGKKEVVVKPELTVKDIISKINDPKVKRILATAATIIIVGKVGLPIIVGASIAHAALPEAVPVSAVSDAVKSKIIHAFDPLIQLTIALSYPIAAVMITAGCLFIMVGNREKGMGMIQMAGLGYILVQLSPLLMKLLVEIGRTV
jgi:hypothetical protein